MLRCPSRPRDGHRVPARMQRPMTMTTTKSKPSPLHRRLRRFHRGVWELHRRRLRLLKRYRFFHAVWAFPVGTILVAATGPAKFLDLWCIATITWLSLSCRIPLHSERADQNTDAQTRWWPSYPWPVTAGLILCAALMGVSAVPTEVIRDIVPEHALALLTETVLGSLILSVAYYFLITTQAKRNLSSRSGIGGVLSTT